MTVTGSSRWDTLIGALHAIRLLRDDDAEIGDQALLQGRIADIQIQSAGLYLGRPAFRWWSDRLGRWEISTLEEILDNTRGFQGPFEVRRAD